jgi:hypothetical protein
MGQLRQLFVSFFWGFLFGLLTYWLCERSPAARVVLQGIKDALHWVADRIDGANPAPVPKEGVGDAD